MPITTQGSTMLLIGDVGDLGIEYAGDENFFTHAEVLGALSRIGAQRKVTVRLNSGGGNAFEGSAIASALQSHPGGVDVLIEGVAASAASVIACAGRCVTMALGSILMLHEASGFTFGTADKHEAAIRELEAVNGAYATLYARRTGKPIDEIRALMAAETWYGAEQAVEAGFVDNVAGAEKQPAAFAYARAYRHAPPRLKAVQPRARRPSPSADPLPVDPPPPPPKPVPAVVAVDMRSPADAAEIAELCMAAEQPEMMATLVREKASLADVTARLDVVGGLKSLVACAKMTGQAVAKDVETEILSGRLTQLQARDRLFESWVAASEETLCDNTKRTGNGSVDSRTLGRMQMEKLVTQKYGAEAVAKHKEKRNGGK